MNALFLTAKIARICNINIMYKYHGDKIAKSISPYAGKICTAIHRPDGKCIRGRNSNMLVSFDGVPVVIPARMLRKV